jgi:hypothetical protein
MRRFFAFIILCLVKFFSHSFYRARYKWLTPKVKNPFKDVHLLIFLNHTSLYEPLFIQVLDISFLWRMSGHMSLPGADVTLNRPLVGLFWKLMIPNITTITRKRDDTWTNYLESINHEDVVFIAPEGRMKRPTGLDKFGQPMTVRGGISDIIGKLNQGTMLICYSGGLHHVQAPGQTLPSLFKTIDMNLELISIADYRRQFHNLSSYAKKKAIIFDLEQRLIKHCPKE